MSCNQITSLKANAFRSATTKDKWTLTTLYALIYCNVFYFILFLVLKSVSRDISHNQIDEIDPKAWNAMPNLVQLCVLRDKYEEI